MKKSKRTIAIAHRVFSHEHFDDAAQKLLRLLNEAQNKFPGAKRHLFLEIDGHRNLNGAFDDEMLELQTKFMSEVLIQFLTDANMPLAKIRNPKPQNDDIPMELNLIKIDPPAGAGQAGMNPRF